MKYEELKSALRAITKVSTDSRVGPDQGDLLRKAKRELEVLAQSGKLDEKRLFRVVDLIATVMLELVKQDAMPRSK